MKIEIIKAHSSPNYSKRIGDIKFIIIHYTDMNFENALAKLCDSAAKVSAHYLIKSTGEIFQLISDAQVAWHAGKSHWCGTENLNEYSIGVELDNDGCTQYTDAQMENCIKLCKFLVENYDILVYDIMGHSDIAPDRKIDPGPFFNWKYFAERGLGLWHDVDVLSLNPKVRFSFGDKSDAVSIVQRKLRQIGYKIAINGVFDLEMNYVVRAFQAHFYPQIVHNIGIDQYQNDGYRYSWDRVSDTILDALIFKLSLTR